MKQVISRKIIITGMTAATVGLALLLSQLGIPFGMGTGAGDGEATSQPGEQRMPEDARAEVPAPTTNPDSETVTEEPTKPKPDVSEMLTVIVAGKGFYWGTNEVAPGVVETITLEKIAELAGETEGSPRGIRARVFRTGSALPSAEKAVMDTLTEAGLSESEILFEERLLDLED